MNFRLGEWNGAVFDMMQPNPDWVLMPAGTVDPYPRFIPKGVDAILTERLGPGALLALDGTRLTGDEKRKLLNSHPDFMGAKPIVQEQIEKCAGWTVMFLPKYHCELNPIELLWCTVKRQLRSLIDGSIGSLRAHVAVVMSEVKYLWVAKWFRHALSYVRGYAKHPLIADIQLAFKYVKNHSHRRSPIKNALIDMTRLNVDSEVRLVDGFFDELPEDVAPVSQERDDCEEDLLRHNMQMGLKSPPCGFSGAMRKAALV